MSKIFDIQELAIAVTAKNLKPIALNTDFLKYTDIIPSDWQEAGQPIYSEGLTQINFQNGISIFVQPNRVVFIEAIALKNLEDVQVASVAAKYVEKFSSVEYQAVGINPRGYVAFSDNEASRYLFEKVLFPGSWQQFGAASPKASIQLAYTLERGQLNLAINEAALKLPEDESVPVVLFAGNFHYEIVGSTREERLQDLQKLIEDWQTPVKSYRELVNQKFLQSDVEVVNATYHS